MGECRSGTMCAGSGHAHPPTSPQEAGSRRSMQMSLLKVLTAFVEPPLRLESFEERTGSLSARRIARRTARMKTLRAPTCPRPITTRLQELQDLTTAAPGNRAVLRAPIDPPAKASTLVDRFSSEAASLVRRPRQAPRRRGM
jgi:hypothetical protein